MITYCQSAGIDQTHVREEVRRLNRNHVYRVSFIASYDANASTYTASFGWQGGIMWIYVQESRRSKVSFEDDTEVSAVLYCRSHCGVEGSNTAKMALPSANHIAAILGVCVIEFLRV